LKYWYIKKIEHLIFLIGYILQLLICIIKNLFFQIKSFVKNNTWIFNLNFNQILILSCLTLILLTKKLRYWKFLGCLTITLVILSIYIIRVVYNINSVTPYTHDQNYKLYKLTYFFYICVLRFNIVFSIICPLNIVNLNIFSANMKDMIDR
jgi:hypothetical protein